MRAYVRTLFGKCEPYVTYVYAYVHMLRKHISIEKIAEELCTSGDLQHDTPRQPCLDKILFENFEIKKKKSKHHIAMVFRRPFQIYIYLK